MFLGNGNQDVNADGNPDLSFHCIFGSAEERFDAQMLFDPFEKQLDLPAAPIKFGNGESGQLKMVRQENKRLLFLVVIKSNATKFVGVVLEWIISDENAGLIAS